MSHFPVFVIGEDVDGQLAPYQEYGDDPTGYEIEMDVTEDVKKTAKERKMTAVRCASEYFDLPLLASGEEPDFAGKHSRGYYTLGKNGRLGRAVSYDNPDSRWDWWVEGGRWSGFLLLKDGTRADSAKLSEVDFDGMRRDREEKAAGVWDRLKEAVGDIPFRTWDKIRASEPDVEKAREIYRRQDALKAIGEKLGTPFVFDDPLEIISRDRSEYIERTAGAEILPFAIVKNGEWREKGHMGWWAAVSDEKPESEWIDEAWKLISSSGSDEKVTVIDCHI